MNWVAVALVVAVLIGVAGGTAIVVRSPTFWVGMGKAVVAALIPAVVRVVSKRMTPEQEKALQDCVRRGGEWDHANKRCKR